MSPSDARPRAIALAVAAVACLCLAGCAEPTLGPSASSASTGRLRSFDLYVSMAATYTPLANHTLTAFAFGLSPSGPFTVPGPELRVTQGDHVRVTLHSGVHTIHWHGVSVPWAMDGVPFMTQSLSDAASAGYVYEFDANEAGTYWYHCHVDAPTHIDAGMYGAFIVEPRDRSQDPPFSREATLILAETDSHAFVALDTADGTHQARPDDIPGNPWDAADAAGDGARQTTDIAGLIAGDTTGQYGGSAGPRPYYPADSIRYRPHYDLFMINGKAFPDTAPVAIKTGETIRIRLINAGQLLHTVHLHGHHFLVTHKDGYNLPAPYQADSLVIGPGERYDIYVTGNNPGIWDLHDHGGAWDVGAYAANDHAFPGGMNTMLVYEDFTAVELPHPMAATSGAYAALAQHGPVHAMPMATDAATYGPAGLVAPPD